MVMIWLLLALALVWGIALLPPSVIERTRKLLHDS
jgi:hypothetical protein